MAITDKEYLNTLKERGKTSHVYKRYQLTGLIISQLLNDDKHKSLYIKLAKQYDNQRLMGVARDVADRKNIKNKGGYFMAILSKSKFFTPQKPSKKSNAGKKSKNSNDK